MDATGFDALSLSVIEALEAVSRSSEKFYGQVGSSYPEMVRELDANFGGKDQANSGGVVLEVTGLRMGCGTIQAYRITVLTGHEAGRESLIPAIFAKKVKR